LAGTREITGP